MKLSDFTYELPKELIAQKPLSARDSSRLLVLDKKRGKIEEKVFNNVIDYLDEGDCLVVNDTRVIPVRLLGRRRTGAKVEIFLLNPGSEELRALVKPSKRIKDGEKIELENGKIATVLGKAQAGRFVEFNAPLDEVIEGGHTPLPPYISREDTEKDKETYQTVYARKDGATAAPTAGLHFTQKLLEMIRRKGVNIAYVTLHTGVGTFAPVKTDNIEEHDMHVEEYELTEVAARRINGAKASGKRVIAVGTTSTRVLESTAIGKNEVAPGTGETKLFIYPGYEFKIVDSIITNFHLPESTLLMLVSAFAGREFVLKAYQEAVERKFRFFSYGDAMMIL